MLMTLLLALTQSAGTNTVLKFLK